MRSCCPDKPPCTLCRGHLPVITIVIIYIMSGYPVKVFTIIFFVINIIIIYVMSISLSPIIIINIMHYHHCHHCHHHLGMPVVDVSCIPIPDSFSIWNKKFLSLDWLQNSEKCFLSFFLEISFNLKGLAGLTCKLEWCHKFSTPGQRHMKGENVFLLLNTLCWSPGKFEEWTKVPDIGLRRTWHPFLSTNAQH